MELQDCFLDKIEKYRGAGCVLDENKTEKEASEEMKRIEEKRTTMNIGIILGTKREAIADMKTGIVRFSDNQEKVTPVSQDMRNKVYKTEDGQVSEYFVKETSRIYNDNIKGIANDLKFLRKEILGAKIKETEGILYTTSPYLFVLLKKTPLSRIKTDILIESNRYDTKIMRTLIALSIGELGLGRDNKAKFTPTKIRLKNKNYRHSKYNKIVLLDE